MYCWSKETITNALPLLIDPETRKLFDDTVKNHPELCSNGYRCREKQGTTCHHVHNYSQFCALRASGLAHTMFRIRDKMNPKCPSNGLVGKIKREKSIFSFNGTFILYMITEGYRAEQAIFGYPGGIFNLNVRMFNIGEAREIRQPREVREVSDVHDVSEVREVREVSDAMKDYTIDCRSSLLI